MEKDGLHLWSFTRESFWQALHNAIFMMAHAHENQNEGFPFSSQCSSWVTELKLHQDTGEKVQLQAAAAEGTEREGDSRLTGKDVEEATTRVVLENPRDITSIPSTSALPRVLLLSEECVHTEQGVRGLL